MALGLDDLSPEKAAILTYGLGLMGTRGPGAFGKAGLMALDARQQAKKLQMLEAEQEQARQMREMQMKQMKAALAEQEQKRQQAQQIRDAASGSMLNRSGVAMMGGGGPTKANAEILGQLPAGTSAFDERGFADKMMQIDPMAGLDLQAKIAAQNKPTYQKLGAEESLYRLDPKNPTGAPQRVAGGGMNPNKPFSIGPNGEPVPNTAYQQYEMSKARAGGTNVDLRVNTEKGLYGTMATGLGASIENQRNAALEAGTAIDTAHSLKRAIDSGKAITGVFGQKRFEWAQAAAQLGITGPDAVVQTRAVIQGLSKLALSARGALKGQGQISDFEGKSLQKAEAGEFDAMTGAEIRAIADVAERGARLRIRQNARNAKLLAGDKSGGAAPMLPFYDIPEPPPYAGPSVVLQPKSPSGATPPDLSLGLDYLQRVTGGR